MAVDFVDFAYVVVDAVYSLHDNLQQMQLTGALRLVSYLDEPLLTLIQHILPVAILLAEPVEQPSNPTVAVNVLYYEMAVVSLGMMVGDKTFVLPVVASDLPLLQ